MAAALTPHAGPPFYVAVALTLAAALSWALVGLFAYGFEHASMRHRFSLCFIKRDEVINDVVFWMIFAMLGGPMCFPVFFLVTGDFMRCGWCISTRVYTFAEAMEIRDAHNERVRRERRR